MLPIVAFLVLFYIGLKVIKKWVRSIPLFSEAGEEVIAESLRDAIPGLDTIAPHSRYLPDPIFNIVDETIEDNTSEEN